MIKDLSRDVCHRFRQRFCAGLGSVILMLLSLYLLDVYYTFGVIQSSGMFFLHMFVDCADTIWSVIVQNLVVGAIRTCCTIQPTKHFRDFFVAIRWACFVTVYSFWIRYQPSTISRFDLTGRVWYSPSCTFCHTIFFSNSLCFGFIPQYFFRTRFGIGWKVSRIPTLVLFCKH